MTDLTSYERSRTIIIKGRKKKLPEQVFRAYYQITEDDQNVIYIPIGLYSFIVDYITLDVEVIDNRVVRNTKLLNTDFHIINIDEFNDILPGITLYEEQLEAIEKILESKRGIINAATGFGKTAVLCGLIKILTQINGVCPTVLILEPSIKLVTDVVKVFNSYGMNAVPYSKNRKILENTVNVAHPKSLGNDLEKDQNLLDTVEVLLGDEVHHMKSDTFRTPTYNMSNLVYSVGVSASAICQEHVSNTRLNQYTYDELLTMGATGPLLMNIPADYLIQKEILAKPILLRLYNAANEEIREKYVKDWQEVSKLRLQSDMRNRLVCKSAKIFSDNKRKVLILVNTISWSRDLMKLFGMMGISDKVLASYGSGKFEVYKDGEFVSGGKDSFDKFDAGEYSIVIGTTHMYEGVDIKNLDVIILAYGGKAERLQIQGLGRALRKSKTGKYAYVVDFTDSGDNFLRNHSITRLKRYIQTIGIPSENIFDQIKVSQIQSIFDKLET